MACSQASLNSHFARVFNLPLASTPFLEVDLLLDFVRMPMGTLVALVASLLIADVTSLIHGMRATFTPGVFGLDVGLISMLLWVPLFAHVLMVVLF